MKNKYKVKFINEKYFFLLLKIRIYNNEIRVLLLKINELYFMILCIKKEL